LAASFHRWGFVGADKIDQPAQRGSMHLKTQAESPIQVNLLLSL
jgi:hypothetical protein